MNHYLGFGATPVNVVDPLGLITTDQADAFWLSVVQMLPEFNGNAEKLMKGDKKACAMLILQQEMNTRIRNAVKDIGVGVMFSGIQAVGLKPIAAAAVRQVRTSIEAGLQGGLNEEELLAKITDETGAIIGGALPGPVADLVNELVGRLARAGVRSQWGGGTVLTFRYDDGRARGGLTFDSTLFVDAEEHHDDWLLLPKMSRKHGATPL